MKISPETARGSRHGNWREIFVEKLLVLFPQETKLESAQNISRPISEQLPCRSAEVKFFSVFLCQRCREIWHEIWREILGKFSVLRFQGLDVRVKISPKFHFKNGMKNGKFHANFTLLGRSADYFHATFHQTLCSGKCPSS